MIQVWILDENNYFTGESIFVEEVAENMTTEPLLIGYIKPLFNGSGWVEGATEEEIQEWKNSNKLEEQPLIKTNQELTEELTNAQIYITELELQNLEMSIQQEAINQRLEALENGK